MKSVTRGFASCGSRITIPPIGGGKGVPLLGEGKRFVKRLDYFFFFSSVFFESVGGVALAAVSAFTAIACASF